MPYYLIYFSLFCYSIYSISKNRNGQIAGSLFALLLALLASLRYDTGTDFNAYQSIWNTTSALNFSFATYEYVEPGFLLVNSLLKAVYKGDFLYFSFYAFTTIMFLYVGLKKLKLNVVFVIFLYYCLFYFAFTFNAMRQALAMAMFVYSLNFLVKGKMKEYFLLNILAMCFHLSSIVYIFFGAIWFFDISKKYFVFSIFLPLIALFIYISGLGYEVFNFFTSALGKPSTYLSEWKEEISIIQWASRIVMLAAISFFTLKHQENKFISSLGFFYIIGFSLYILFADVAMLSSRLNMAFRIVEIIIAGLLLIEYRTISNKFFVFFVFMIPYSIQFLINASNPDNQYILRATF